MQVQANLKETEMRPCGRMRDHVPGGPEYCETAEGRWAGVVREYIGNLRYGEVILTVHEGKVVQIERSEKVRF